MLILFALLLIAGQNSFHNDFNPEMDILSLHYDHAPDKDDGHSAAADRTILESLFGKDWIAKHVVAVSGTYGENKDQFNSHSDLVMDAAWRDCGGWLSAHMNREAALNTLMLRWVHVLKAGGDVWVKEGGQSDITAAAVKQVQKNLPSVDTSRRIHVVQHSDWNEAHTTDSDLAYTKSQTDYIRISDANAYLKSDENIDAFVVSALNHMDFYDVWESAFDYNDPFYNGLDFSDTGELMYILDLGKIDIDGFRKHFLR